MLDGQLDNDEGLTARQLILDPEAHTFILDSSVFTGTMGRQIAPFVRQALINLVQNDVEYRRRAEPSLQAVGRSVGGGHGVQTPAASASSGGHNPAVLTGGPQATTTGGGKRSVRKSKAVAWAESGGSARPGLGLSGALTWDDDDGVAFWAGGPSASDRKDKAPAIGETGKRDMNDLRCGAKYWLDGDGKMVISPDGDGITKRIADGQHILRMMSESRWKALFGSGLRIDIGNVRSVLDDHYMHFMLMEECDEEWASIEHYDSIRELPAVKDDKKLTILLKGRWDWQQVRELSLLDFVKSGTQWKAWERHQRTMDGLQYLREAMRNALLVLEVIFGVPCADIGRDLLEVFSSSRKTLGTTDAYNFHVVNYAFSKEFRYTRLHMLSEPERDDPATRLYGADAFVRRLAARFSAIIPRIPTGIAKTVVMDTFNRVSYPRINWHTTKDGKRRGTKREHESSSESESGDSEEELSPAEKKKVKNKAKNEKRKARRLENAKAAEKKSPEGVKSKGDGDELGQPHQHLCGFHLAHLLKMTNRAGKIIECTKQSCKAHHLPSIHEYTREELKALIPATWSHFGAETRKKYEQAIAALPEASFKST
jgi:hypothetical protein